MNENQKIRTMHLERPRCAQLTLNMRLVDVLFPYEEMEIIRLVKEFDTNDGCKIWKVELKHKGPNKYKHNEIFKTYTDEFIRANFRLLKYDLVIYQEFLESPL